MASIGHELLNVPFGDMVMQLANAIAEGQFKMDMTSCKIASMMGNKEVCGIEIPNFSEKIDGSETVSLIGAGFMPTFYQFTDTIIEVKISISMCTSIEASASAGFSCSCASVIASFSAKYSYSAEGSSLIRTKITPVPPNTFMQKLLDLKAQLEQKKFEQTFKMIEEEIAKGETASKSSAEGTAGISSAEEAAGESLAAEPNQDSDS